MKNKEFTKQQQLIVGTTPSAYNADHKPEQPDITGTIVNAHVFEAERTSQRQTACQQANLQRPQSPLHGAWCSHGLLVFYVPSTELRQTQGAWCEDFPE